MPAYGDNIQEIILRIKAEGVGEADKVRQAMAGVREHVEGLFAQIAQADGSDFNFIAKMFRDIGKANSELATMDKFLASIGQSETANAKEAARERAEIAKQERIEREINLKQAAAAAKAAIKEETDARKAASREEIEAEKKSRAERANALKEARAREKAAAKERSDLEKEERREREHNLREAQRQEENLAKLRSAMAKLGARQVAETLKEEDVEREHNLNQETRRIERLKNQAEQGKEAANKFGYGLLHISHAIQDMQYGFGAVLNNIPLVAQAIGFGPGIAGTAMIAGVGISVFGDKIKQLGRDMMLLRDPTKEAAVTVGQMEEKLAALIEKPWKLDIDYQAIERGKREIGILEERLQSYQAALKKQTPMQEKIGKVALGAVSDFGSSVDQGEAGGTANLGKVVAEMARRTGLLDIEMARDPRAQKARAAKEEADRDEQLIRTGMIPPEEVQSLRQKGAASRAQADADMAAVKSETMTRILGDTVGAAVKGNADALKKLIDLLARPDAQEILRRGNVSLGIQPSDPKLMGMLRSALPTEIEAREARQDRNEQAKSGKTLRNQIAAEKKAAVDAEVASLVSSKAKPLEGALGDEILTLIGAGSDRKDLMGLAKGVQQGIGMDVPHSKEAAATIVRQVIERIYKDVIAMKVGNPGMTDQEAAARIIRGDAETEEARAAKKAKKEGIDPVTGKPLTEADKNRLRIRQQEFQDMIDARKRAEKAAQTPQGRQALFNNRQLVQRQGVHDQIARENPNLNAQQVARATQIAYQKAGQGMNRNSAILEALLQLNREFLQSMQVLAARNQGHMGEIRQQKIQSRRIRQNRGTLLRNPMPVFNR